MASPLASLIAWRDELLAARATGARRFRDSNGEEIEYRSVRELTAAISALDREIEKLSGRAMPKTIVFKTSKGL
ncbi:MAG: hypothetical protein GC187_11895 [Alphaproteobacteria bacterium]|nr:hypothetical protein [Alphaproteobacteria bacterium]